MTIEENEIYKFKDKKRFVLCPCLGQGWIIEVYDIDDRLLGRIFVRNKAELLMSLDDSLPEDIMEIHVGEN